jgi:hypothetical protein
MRALILFVASWVISGIYTGLQDRFGPNVIAGYRAYRKERKAWDAAVEQMSSGHQETEPQPPAAAPDVIEIARQTVERLKAGRR